MAIFKGNNSNNSLTGGTGNDSLYGYAGSDTLNGGGGNDVLDGGLDIDKLIGGAGNDTYVVDQSEDIIQEKAGGGTDTVRSSTSYILSANIENLILTGSASLDGTGNASKNNIKGNSGANNLIGNSGNDVLDGFTGIDTINGGSGNDLLKISDFNSDIINGGTGKDTLEIYGSNQQIDFSTLNHSLTELETIKFSGGGNNSLTLSLQDVLDLSSETNTLFIEGDANDTLNLDAGWKKINSKAGYDVYTLQDATIYVINKMTVNMQEASSYVISDATSAEQVGSFFTDAPEEVVIDFGGMKYIDTDLAAGVIDLFGFGLEDTLVIALHDGLINDETEALTFFGGSTISGDRRFMQQVREFGTSIYSVSDYVLWLKSATTAKMKSRLSVVGNGIFEPYKTTIQIIGLPSGLPDTQFVFV